MIKKIILILLVSIFVASYCYADLTIALQQKGDDIFVMVQDNKEEYSCEGVVIIKEDGRAVNIITCCNCKSECIEIIIPTKKIGT